MKPEAGPSRPKISFGGLKKVVPSVGGGQSVRSAGQAAVRRPFGGEEDDDDVNDDEKSGTAAAAPFRLGSAPISRAAQHRQEEALAQDASVFDYDGVFDSMKAAERASKASRNADRRTRDPKYMQASLAASEQRKVDRTRAEARKIQREREQEGDTYDDRESFVTEAYKRQMSEMNKEEEREREQEEKERKTSKGVAGFYKNLLSEQDRTHQAAVEATAAMANKVSAAQVGEQEPSEEHRKRQRIDEARRKGLDVRLNDENDVVDERSLLSAGLNTFAKRKQPPASATSSSDGRTTEEQQMYRGGQDNAQRSARDAQRVRQSKLIEEQMLEMQRKREEEERAEAHAQKQLAIGERRNDADRIEQARQRALERRKQREQDNKASTKT